MTFLVERHLIREGEPLQISTNLSILSQNIKRGYLMEDKKAEGGGKKQYILTHSGEEAIETQIAQRQS